MSIPAVILAGGRGTRLKSVISEVPKPMAPINNRPFLEYLINYVSEYDINPLILSVGYRKDIIMRHFGSVFGKSRILYATEETPLGTGGAIKNAINFVTEDKFLVLNGDTWFSLNYRFFLERAEQKKCVIAIRRERSKNRYGSVKVENDFMISGFYEKNENVLSEWMNAGIYVFDKSTFLRNCPVASSFSLERDVLPQMASSGVLYGIPMEGDFIDIGIPEDYERAKKIIRNPEHR